MLQRHCGGGSAVISTPPSRRPDSALETQAYRTRWQRPCASHPNQPLVARADHSSRSGAAARLAARRPHLRKHPHVVGAVRRRNRRSSHHRSVTLAGVPARFHPGAWEGPYGSRRPINPATVGNSGGFAADLGAPPVIHASAWSAMASNAAGTTGHASRLDRRRHTDPARSSSTWERPLSRGSVSLRHAGACSLIGRPGPIIKQAAGIWTALLVTASLSRSSIRRRGGDQGQIVGLQRCDTDAM
jgi:hypothetical protein